MTANLTTDIRIRAPRREDMQAIVDLVVACDVADLGAPDFSLDILEEDWKRPVFSLEQDAWLLENDEGQLLAYGMLESGHGGVQLNGLGWVHPEHRRRGLGSQLLTLQEKRARERVDEAPEGTRVVQQAWGQGSAPVQRLFAKYELVHVRSAWRMLIEMNEQPPEPRWPDGVQVRSWTEDMDRAVHAANEEAFADHWGHTPDDPYEEWKQGRENMAHFEADLWLLAMAGDEIAGVCLSTYFMDQGYVQDLSVRRPWRRQGLGLALLHEAFGRFWQRGTKTVSLGVDSQNLTGATRLYERAGMHVQYQFDRYEKELRPGREIRNMG
jgi:mycothiol synthase